MRVRRQCRREITQRGSPRSPGLRREVRRPASRVAVAAVPCGARGRAQPDLRDLLADRGRSDAVRGAAVSRRRRSMAGASSGRRSRRRRGGSCSPRWTTRAPSTRLVDGSRRRADPGRRRAGRVRRARSRQRWGRSRRRHAEADEARTSVPPARGPTAAAGAGRRWSRARAVRPGDPPGLGRGVPRRGPGRRRRHRTSRPMADRWIRGLGRTAVPVGGRRAGRCRWRAPAG